MSQELELAVVEGMRLLFLLIVPVLLAAAAGGVVGGAMQTVFAISDPAIGFLFRWGGVALAVVLTAAQAGERLLGLLPQAAHG